MNCDHDDIALQSSDVNIDDSYYDDEYFLGERHLRRADSAFQRYRIANVLGLHSPTRTDRVLDMGTGWGTIAFAAAPMAREVVGVDFSEHSIAFCRERLIESGLSNVRFELADARASGLQSESFDVVYAADLFEHLYPVDSDLVTAEAYRVLRPGGTIVIWMPCRSHVFEVMKNRNIVFRREVGHVDYKSMSRTKGMLTKAGFEIEFSRYVGSHLPVLRVVERIGGRWIPLLRRRIGVVAVKR